MEKIKFFSNNINYKIKYENESLIISAYDMDTLNEWSFYSNKNVFDIANKKVFELIKNYKKPTENIIISFPDNSIGDKIIKIEYKHTIEDNFKIINILLVYEEDTNKKLKNLCYKFKKISHLMTLSTKLIQSISDQLDEHENKLKFFENKYNILINNQKIWINNNNKQNDEIENLKKELALLKIKN